MVGAKDKVFEISHSVSKVSILLIFEKIFKHKNLLICLENRGSSFAVSLLRLAQFPNAV